MKLPSSGKLNRVRMFLFVQLCFAPKNIYKIKTNILPLIWHPHGTTLVDRDNLSRILSQVDGYLKLLTNILPLQMELYLRII